MEYNVEDVFENKYGKVTIIDSYIKNKEMGDRYYVLKWDSGEIRDVSRNHLTQRDSLYNLEKIKREVSYKFKNRFVPRTQRERKELVGQTFPTKRCGDVTIMEYYNSKDVEVGFHNTGNIYRGVRLERIKGGDISDVNERGTKHNKVRYRYVGNLFGGSVG